MDGSDFVKAMVKPDEPGRNGGSLPTEKNLTRHHFTLLTTHRRAEPRKERTRSLPPKPRIIVCSSKSKARQGSPGSTPVVVAEGASRGSSESWRRSPFSAPLCGSLLGPLAAAGGGAGSLPSSWPWRMAALAELLLGSAPPVDWEAEAFPAYGDFAVLPFVVAFFPAVRFLLDRFVFEILARRLALGKECHKLDETCDRKKINKFKESAWKCIYFFSGELLSLSVTYNEPWFKNSRYFWVGPGEQVWPDQKMKLKLKAVYIYAAGFYTYSIFALLFWETRRSDFGVSMSHHVATVVLIVLSYIFRFARVGSVVLALHDASDIFLEIGKMAKYSSCEWLAVVAFLLFVASWILLRLVIFPFWILRSTSYEVLLTLDKKKHKFYGPIYYYVFNSLLFSLLVLHIYWWILIYRMLIKQIQAKGRVGDDVRSDSEDEGEHED